VGAVRHPVGRARPRRQDALVCSVALLHETFARFPRDRFATLFRNGTACVRVCDPALLRLQADSTDDATAIVAGRGTREPRYDRRVDPESSPLSRPWSSSPVVSGIHGPRAPAGECGAVCSPWVGERRATWKSPTILMPETEEHALGWFGRWRCESRRPGEWRWRVEEIVLHENTA